MGEFFLKLFDTSGFPARWECGPAWRQSPELGWLHIVSDLLVFSAYLSIPLLLIYFVKRRTDLVFPRIFWLFGAFIFSCGTTHLIEAGIFYHPVYRFSALAKLITAVVSWITVFALIHILPQALELPGVSKLLRTNLLLQEEIEERRQMQDELHLSQERFQLAIAGTDEGIWEWTSLDDRVWYAPRFLNLLGFENSAELEPGLSGLLALVHPDQRKLVQKEFQTHIGGNTSRLDIECQLLTREQRPVWFHIRGTSLRDSEGQVTRLAGAIRDVTERKQHEQALQAYVQQLDQRNEELDKFTYIASHDLKAPLRGIDNLSQWIMEDSYQHLPDPSRRHLDLLRQRVLRLEGLLDDLLAYSRAGRLDMQGEIAHVDVRQLLQEVIGLLDIPAGFEIGLPERLPVLETLKVPLSQVFLNLIVNALKHHDKPAGRIQIACVEERECLRFSVTDDGPGIDPQFHDRIFRMFSTLKPRDQVEGSGMGLALVQRTLEVLGGRIEVASQSGQGACFTFWWPRMISRGRIKSDKLTPLSNS